MNPTAFITGATSGIGRATAFRLAQNNWNLILNARREALLSELKKDLEDKFDTTVKILAFDVSDRKQCENAFTSHQAFFEELSVLINNAGLARGIDPLDQGSLDDWEQMIDTNLKGLLYVTRLSLPFLKNNKNSHIVNIGSVAGRWTYPGGGVYCSTKFAVRALTESLRLDLHGSNIRVTNISPGLVQTKFSEVRLRDKEQADAVYQGFKPLSAEDIADSIEWSLSRPAHVNIQEMVIFPTDQASVTVVNRS